MRAKRRLSFGLVLAAVVAVAAIVIPSRAATPVVFFSGDLLAGNTTNMGVKAHNSTGHAITATAHIFRLDGSEVSGAASFNVLPHATHVFNFTVPGVAGNCECTVKLKAASAGIIPSVQYIPAGATQQVDIPAGGFVSSPLSDQTFFSGDLLADHASNMGVKAHNATGGSIGVTATVFRLDGSQVSAPVGFVVLPHNTHVFNFVVPGVIGNCECTVKMHALKPGIVPSVQYIPAGATQQVDVPAGEFV